MLRSVIRKFVVSKPIPAAVGAKMAEQGAASVPKSAVDINDAEGTIQAPLDESGAGNKSIRIRHTGCGENENLIRTKLSGSRSDGAGSSGMQSDVARSIGGSIGKQPAALGPRFDIISTGDLIEIRLLRNRARSMKKKVALVPTMGALHDGHLKLIQAAALDNHEVFVSIYVNPTQFGLNEDLKSYPKPWKEDLEKLTKLNERLLRGCEYKGRITTVFRPSTEVMYPTLPPTSEPNGFGSFITITPLANVLEGASRPVFFRGVATVVMKLLNIVQPDQVYFGQKDIQQLLVIRRLMKDFHINTTLRMVETERDKTDGLALSSRNVYLGDRRRAVAPILHKALRAGHLAMVAGKQNRQDIVGAAIEVAAEALQEQRKLPPSQRVRFEIDYLSLADPDTLDELEVLEHGKSAILSGAMVMFPIEIPQPGENTGARGGKLPVRLIDNYIHGVKALFPGPPLRRLQRF